MIIRNLRVRKKQGKLPNAKSTLIGMSTATSHERCADGLVDVML